jgi:L-ascorbate metabolism protein UlaG (beta-lactamase superfamily)
MEAANTPAIQYIGHGTVLVELDGVRLLTDPLLRGRVAHLRRAGGAEAMVPPDLDAVLISHLHFDHLDFGSLARLGPDVRVVVPRGAGALVGGKSRRENVTEIAAGETIEIDGLRVRATPAEHGRTRLPFGARADPLGYRLEGERSVYFAGDTDVFPGMAEIGSLDVALVPVWGWGPSMGPGHMNPARAAESLGLLRPRIAIPIHWGTYYPWHLGLRGPPSWLDTPPLTFKDAAAAVAPDVDVRILRPGERTSI